MGGVENSDPLKNGWDYMKLSVFYIHMCDVDRCSLFWEFKDFFVIARESETILLLFLSYSFFSSFLFLITI